MGPARNLQIFFVGSDGGWGGWVWQIPAGGTPSPLSERNLGNPEEVVLFVGFFP